jgi:chemosensory pili system protein ChpA (sensor histidine kinase/response regulator)
MIQALVVDDVRAMVDGICRMLALLDIQAAPAYGSRAAIIQLNENTPDVVFLDLNMPGLGGTDVISYMQREPRLAEVPVIVVTSDDQAETAERVRTLGARDLLVKPVKFEDLEAVLRKIGLL